MSKKSGIYIKDYESFFLDVALEEYKNTKKKNK